MMKMAIVGDLHLGYRQYGLDEREKDFYQRWNDVVDNIISHNVDVVFQLGDIFDTHIPSAIALYEYEQGLDKLHNANIKYYSITGNHTIIRKKNFMSPDDLFSKISEATSLDDSYIVLDNLFIAGVRYRSESDKQELIDVIQSQAKEARRYNGIKILLLHQAIETDLIYGAELSERDVPYDDFDYIFIGHLHSRIERQYRQCHIIYPGSIERSSITEAKDAINRGKGFYILDSVRNECSWINIPLSREFCFVDVNSEDDIKTFKNQIAQMSEKPIVELNFNMFDIERAHHLGQTISSDCLRLSIRVTNDTEDSQDDELLIDKSTYSIQKIIEQKISKKEAVFAYELLQIFNKNDTVSENISSAIELCDDYFNQNY